MMYTIQPMLIVVMRVMFGLALATALSMIGIGIAWAMFVFFGATSLTTLLTLFMVGAGFGAGMGVFLAWLSIDGNTRLYFTVAISVAFVAGVSGAWGGYVFGSGVEVECCAKSDVTPITYTALGATVGANAVGLIMGVGRKIITKP